MAGSEVILCFGDSLTFGVPGVSWLRHVSPRKRFINMGVGGDTLVNMKYRLQPVIGDAAPRDPGPKTLVLEIGTNDLLLPHMEQRSDAWSVAVRAMVRLGKVLCRDADRFETEYREMLEQVAAGGHRALIVGIPCIGEETDSPLNAQVDELNRRIFSLCAEYGFPVADIGTWQKEQIRAGGKAPSPYLLKDKPTGAFGDTLWTTWLPFANRVGRRRGLFCTVDGIHFNDRTARALAARVAQWAGTASEDSGEEEFERV